MRQCPDCSAPLLAPFVSCNACSWGIGKGEKVRDPLHLVCCHVFQGQRCAEPGALSEGIKGEGPWYCARHFPPFANRNWGKPTPPPRGFQPLKDILRKVDPESAAERAAIQGEPA